MYNNDSSITQKNKNVQVADYAHKIDQRIKNLRYSIDNSFLELAKSLKEVRDKKLYKQLNIETFESYIAQPELAFERRSVYNFIEIYEQFIEGYNVHPDALLEAGWTKLAKVLPYTNENNYSVMLEKASTLSRSDLDKDLVEQGFITRKEVEPQFVQCPFCHKDFVPTKRQDKQFSQEDYKQVIDAYKDAKELELSGKEYDPIMQSIKTMFMNGRTRDQIVSVISWLKDNAEYEWTIHTVKNKIAEILPKIEPKHEKSDFDRRWGL